MTQEIEFPDTPGGVTPTILTMAEAAAYLGIPKATLYTWRTRRIGQGPRALKIGGLLRYRRSDLDAWIEEHLETIPDRDDDESGRGEAPSSGVSFSRQRLRR